MEYGLRPPDAHEIGRQSAVVLGGHQEHHLPVGHIGDRGQRSLERVHGEGHVSAIEIAAHERHPRFGIEDRIVVGTVGFDGDPLGYPAQGIVQNTRNLGRAADGVGVLKALGGILLQLGQVGQGFQELQQFLRNPDLSRKGFRPADFPMEMVRLSLQGMDRQGRGADRGIEDSRGPFNGGHRNTGHDGGAVHHGEMLFHLERVGDELRPGDRFGGRHPSAAVEYLPLPAQGGGDVGHGGQITGGPDGTLGGDNGCNAQVQEGGDLLQQRQGYPRVATGKAKEAADHGGARFLDAEGFAGAAAMKGQGAGPVLSKGFFFGKALAAGFAIPGVDAVDGDALFHRVGQHALRAFHPADKGVRFTD